ncbi:MAG: hypothetical protein QM487_04215, partial [Candidatus Marithrix sp.]
MDTDTYRIIIESPFIPRSIVSYGLIVYCIKTNKWLLTQRKHSIEFLLYFGGDYRVSYLTLLLSYITSDEAKIIKMCLKNPEYIFRKIYIQDLELFPNDLEYAYS